MKRLIALLLALSALFSLAACGRHKRLCSCRGDLPGKRAVSERSEVLRREVRSGVRRLERRPPGTEHRGLVGRWRARRLCPRGAAALLSGADGKNAVCSPVNVYMALSMLAEVTDGDTRAQILSLLGADSMESLRKTAGNVWAANYQNDGAVTSILADSLWLSDSMDYNSNTLARLADSYYASAYRGEMGSETFNEALRRWINEQTGGLLKDSADGLSLAPGDGDRARLDHILPREVGQRVFKERHGGRRIPRAGRRRDAQIHARDHGEHVLRRR